MTREEALDKAVEAIGSALRKRFSCGPVDLYVQWHLDPDGHAELRVKAQGFGAVASNHPDFDDALTELRDEHIDVLDAERWVASVGERTYLAEMPSEVFAARMRSKVK